MNKTEAIKAARVGSAAACISAIMTIVVVLIAINTDADGKLLRWNDSSNFIDVFIVLVCALGMYKKSRVAAIAMFLYFIVAKIGIAVEQQEFSGIAMSLLFVYFYGKAVQGTIIYHKLEKKEDPNYKATNKWMYIFGTPLAAIFCFLIGISLMSTTGVIPSTKVQFNNEISLNDINTLKDNGVITDEESIEAFYSQGLSSVLESGNILTSERVILYWSDDDKEIQVYSMLLTEVSGVTLESKGSLIDDSVYKVSSDDPEVWLKLFLSTEQKGDEKFVSKLEART